MAFDCGLTCNVTDARVTYSPISGFANLWDEEDVVTYEVDEQDLQEHTDHTGELMIRSGNNIAMTNVTLNLFPCSDWYIDLFNAWMENKLICGDLIVDDPCCMRLMLKKASISSMGVKPISHNSNPTEIVFRGILSKV